MGRRRTEARKERLVARLDDAASRSGAPVARVEDPVEALIARARRERTRGDMRRAAVLLREACALDEWRPRSWTLLAALLAGEGRCEEAAKAFHQARWLRVRAGEKARAAVTERLAARLATAA